MENLTLLMSSEREHREGEYQNEWRKWHIIVSGVMTKNSTGKGNHMMGYRGDRLGPQVLGHNVLLLLFPKQKIHTYVQQCVCTGQPT